MHLFIKTHFYAFTVKYISHPDNSTTLEVESQLENPLIDVHHQDFNDLRKFPIPEIHHHRTHHKKNHSNDEQERE